jgi:hypothetical protein
MSVTPNQIAADLLLDELASLGVSARVENGNLHLVPKSKVTPQLVARLTQHKPEVVRAARLAALNDDQLDAWNERVAICMVDGGLGQEEAEAVAWREIEGHQVQPVDAHARPRAASVAAGEEGANG